MVQLSQMGFIDLAETPDGKSCLTGDSLVMVASGKHMFINELKNGDQVVTVSENGTLVLSEICNWFELLPNSPEWGTRKLYKIISGTLSIKATSDHPFLTIDGYIMAKKLTVDDFVYIYDNGVLREQKIDQ